MKIWIIDTESIIAIRRELPVRVRGTVIGALNARVASGSIVFPPEVFGELERQSEGLAKKGDPDIPFKWAKAAQVQATRYGHLYAGAKLVLNRIPNLIDASKVSVGGVDDADPHTIALAIRLRDEGHDATIITGDVLTKPAKTALADAAGVFGVPCVRFKTFLVTEEIWDGKEGT